jgi:hypothetical protein
LNNSGTDLNDLLQKTGRYYFCTDCPDAENCSKDGAYIYPGVSRLLSFWNKEQQPYSGNWMNQPMGFSQYMGICNSEKAAYLQRETVKRKR